MKPTSILNRNFILICIINCVTYFSQFMTNTLLPRYANSLGAAATLVGFLSSAFSITALITKPFSSPAVDSLDKKKIMLSGLILIVIANAGYAFAKTYPVLLAFRFLHGCAVGLTVITCLTMASAALPEEKLTSGIAYFSMLQAVASAVGPSLGLKLADSFGYPAAFTVSSVFGAVAALLLFGVNLNESDVKPPFRVNFKTILAVEAIPAASIMLCLAAAYITVSSFLVIYAESIGIERIGLFFTINAIALMTSRPTVGKLAEKFGTAKVLPMAIACYALSLLLISTAKSLLVFLIAAVLLAFGYGACQPLIQALCIKSVPPSRRGAASATSYYGTDFGYILSPLISGVLIDRFGYAVMFRCMIGFLLLAIVIFLFARKKIQAIEGNTVN